jgi:hypothetical protein
MTFLIFGIAGIMIARLCGTWSIRKVFAVEGEP